MRLLALLPILFITPALACEEPATLTRDQVRKSIATIEEAASNTEKVFAYQDLMCSDSAVIRSLATETALRHGSDGLKSHILLETVMQRQNLVLEVYDTGDLNKAQRDFAKATPALSYDFVNKDKARSCVGLINNHTCKAGYTLDVRGTGVSITYYGTLADLVLDDDGILKGFYMPKGGKVRIPVRANLF